VDGQWRELSDPSHKNRKEEKMKSGLVALCVAVSIAITMAWSGPILAGDKAPEPGTYEYQGALESGSLPTSPIGAWKEAMDSAGKTVLAEAGGAVYRIGIDTP
jgi:hypothetical protein